VKITRLIALVCLCGEAMAGQSPRQVSLAESEVLTVRTTPGYSTILQFDTRPTSVVLGDQDSFKVEYLKNSLTIKPLKEGVTTNLFVFTDYDRFSFRLTSVESNADYVIRVAKKSERARRGSKKGYKSGATVSDLDVTTVDASKSIGSMTLKVISIGYPPSGQAAIIEFSVKSEHPFSIDSSQVALEQDGASIPIQELHSAGQQIGILVVRTSNFQQGVPLNLKVKASDHTWISVAVTTRSTKGEK